MFTLSTPDGKERLHGATQVLASYRTGIHVQQASMTDKRWLPGPGLLTGRENSAQPETGSTTASKSIGSFPWQRRHVFSPVGAHEDWPFEKRTRNLEVLPPGQAGEETPSFLLQAAHLHRWGSTGLLMRRDSNCREERMNISWAPVAVNKSWVAPEERVAPSTLDNGCSALSSRTPFSGIVQSVLSTAGKLVRHFYGPWFLNLYGQPLHF